MLCSYLLHYASLFHLHVFLNLSLQKYESTESMHERMLSQSRDMETSNISHCWCSASGTPTMAVDQRLYLWLENDNHALSVNLTSAVKRK